MLFCRYIALPTSEWRSSLDQFEHVGATYTSESVEANNDLPGLRRLVLKYLLPVVPSEERHVLLPYNALGTIRLPIRMMDGHAVVPQPNAMTCTLACAWMKMLDVYGETFFQYPQLSLFKNEMVLVHFKLTLNTIPKKRRTYQLVQCSFLTAGSLQALINRYGAGAIGIRLNQNTDHWVLVDRVTRVVTAEKKAYCHHVLTVRDPATSALGKMCVKFTSRGAYLLDTDKHKTSAKLLNDFTTIQAQPLDPHGGSSG
jgi:hypothetical protein